jgi:hypothetical protein
MARLYHHGSATNNAGDALSTAELQANCGAGKALICAIARTIMPHFASSSPHFRHNSLASRSNHGRILASLWQKCERSESK